MVSVHLHAAFGKRFLSAIDLNPLRGFGIDSGNQREHVSIPQHVQHVCEIGTRIPLDLAAQSNREGTLDSFSLGSYILLLDYTARLHRTGKAKIDTTLTEVFERLSETMAVDTWQTRIDLRGSFFATSTKTVAALTTADVHHQNQTIKPPD